MLLASPGEIDFPPLLVGAATSLVVGLFALAWLLRWLQQGRLYLFA